MEQKTIVQAGKFAIVGVLNTAVDFAILNALVFLGFTAALVIYGQKFLLANVVSTSVAMVNSFILNRRWSFESRSADVYGEIVKFLIVTLIGVLLVNQLIFNFFYFSFHAFDDYLLLFIRALGLSRFLTDAFIVLNFSKVMAVVGTLIWNFLGYKFMVFRNKETAAAEARA